MSARFTRWVVTQAQGSLKNPSISTMRSCNRQFWSRAKEARVRRSVLGQCRGSLCGSSTIPTRMRMTWVREINSPVSCRDYQRLLKPLLRPRDQEDTQACLQAQVDCSSQLHTHVFLHACFYMREGPSSDHQVPMGMKDQWVWKTLVEFGLSIIYFFILCIHSYSVAIGKLLTILMLMFLMTRIVLDYYGLK